MSSARSAAVLQLLSHRRASVRLLGEPRAFPSLSGNAPPVARSPLLPKLGPAAELLVVATDAVELNRAPRHAQGLAAEPPVPLVCLATPRNINSVERPKSPPPPSTSKSLPAIPGRATTTPSTRLNTLVYSAPNPHRTEPRCAIPIRARTPPAPPLVADAVSATASPTDLTTRRGELSLFERAKSLA